MNKFVFYKIIMISLGIQIIIKQILFVTFFFNIIHNIIYYDISILNIIRSNYLYCEQCYVSSMCLILLLFTLI